MKKLLESPLGKIVTSASGILAALSFVSYMAWTTYANPLVKETAKKEAEELVQPLLDSIEVHSNQIREIKKQLEQVDDNVIEAKSFLYVLSSPEQREKAKEMAEMFKKKRNDD